MQAIPFSLRCSDLSNDSCDFPPLSPSPASQLPDEAKELDRELRAVTKDKNEAVRNQDFEKAGDLRDKEMDLKARISAIVESSKEQSKAEVEAAGGDVGPMVTESDIAHVVAAWTGIPVDKVSSDESERLLKMEGTLHQRVIGQDEAVKAIRWVGLAHMGPGEPRF